MTYLLLGARLAFGVFLVLHGLAHAPAIVASWGSATFEDASYQPNVLLTDASDGVVRLLGAVWLAAGAAFVLAGIGLLLRADWWPPLATAAVLTSLAVTGLWREDAIVGLVINAVLVVVLVGLAARTTLLPRRAGPAAG